MIIQPLQVFQGKVKLNAVTLFLLVRLVNRIGQNTLLREIMEFLILETFKQTPGKCLLGTI